MSVIDVFTIWAMLCASADAGCSGGRCTVDDQINLMQFRQTVASGSERQYPRDSEEIQKTDADLHGTENTASEAVFEKYMMEDAGPTPPPGCVDQGCIGSGPHCGGNENSCTSQGMIVTGYYKTCGWDTCQTGFKARCALCPAAVAAKNAPYPAPGPGPALWTAPAPAPPQVAPTPGPFPTYDPMPTDTPVFAPPAYDEYALGNATLALKNAKALVVQLKSNLTKAKALESAVQKNISKFKTEAQDAHHKYVSNRDTAVSYAKKVELANITIAKAQKAMSNAYYAEKGAAQGAQDNLAKATSYNAQKRYYQKRVVDRKFATSAANHEVELAKAAVKKAQSDLDTAKKVAGNHAASEKSKNAFKLNVADSNTATAQQMAVKASMESAYVDSSSGSVPALNLSNIPPYGGESGY